MEAAPAYFFDVLPWEQPHKKGEIFILFLCVCVFFGDDQRTAGGDGGGSLQRGRETKINERRI